MTSQFILRAAPGAVVDADALASQLQRGGQVQVVDRSPRMLLVAGTKAAVARALQGSSGWTMIAETTTPLPDPRPRIKRVPPDS